MTRRVLIVDDDPVIRASLAEALADDGITVSVAEDGARALAMLADTEPDVVLSDVRMPDVGGLALQDLLRERAPEVDVILMTAFDDMPTVVSAMRGGAVEFLVKPVSLSKLRQVMTRVFQDRRLRKRAAANGETDAPPGDFLIGRDERMIDVYKLVGQAAATRATVLIRGESGTGKELIARAIHANSHAAREPFVPVNCAAVPSTLLESELFGHVRGAFTGAVRDKAGLFEVAGNGTIFLDEIGEIALTVQAKLLRALQEREIRRVGAERSIRVTARVVAATNRDLRAAVESGTFREDLYFRLGAFVITVPSLRDRRDDIPPLVHTFLVRAAARMKKDVRSVSAEAMSALMNYRWPGNVRELEHAVERAVILANYSNIRLRDLPPEVTQKSRPRPGEDTLDLQEQERVSIERALERFGGNRRKAADALKISTVTLWRKMKQYGLS